MQLGVQRLLPGRQDDACRSALAGRLGGEGIPVRRSRIVQVDQPLRPCKAGTKIIAALKQDLADGAGDAPRRGGGTEPIYHHTQFLSSLGLKRSSQHRLVFFSSMTATGQAPPLAF
jgi:hypothetical protein